MRAYVCVGVDDVDDDGCGVVVVDVVGYVITRHVE
jgi:hypothetical protein